MALLSSYCIEFKTGKCKLKQYHHVTAIFVLHRGPAVSPCPALFVLYIIHEERETGKCMLNV